MRYLISGIGPGNSGVGRLMKVLVPEYQESGYKVIYKRENKSIREFLNSRRYISAVTEYLLRYVYNVLFLFKTFFIKNSEIIFLHPQTAGFNLFLNLIKKNQVSLYVMDNSFFCIRSYNTHPFKNIECIKCIKNIDPHKLCKPFPVKMKRSKNIVYLEKLQKNAERIKFLSQNALQTQLLKKHFGSNIKVSIIGMDTNEILPVEQKAYKKEKTCQYDVVFHGATLIAKGVLYVIEVAENLPEYTFLIPDDKNKVESVVERSLPSNIIAKAMSWETGLRDNVRSARLVINPSMWSAPIEGALLKSAAFNTNVATVKTEYGYEKEVRTIKNHLRLNSNPQIGAKQLKEFFKYHK